MAQNAPSEVQKFWDSNMVATTGWKTAVKGKVQLDAVEYQQHHAALSKCSKTATIACPCSGCGQTSRRMVDAVRHLAGAHCAWYRGFKCAQCGTACKTGAHLESHINNKHINVLRYSCPVRGCTKGFKDDGARNAHKRKAHSAEELAVDDQPKNARSSAARERREKKAKSRSKSPQLTLAAQAAPQQALPTFELQTLTAPQPDFWTPTQEVVLQQTPESPMGLGALLDPVRSYLDKAHMANPQEPQTEYPPPRTVAPGDLQLVKEAPPDEESEPGLSICEGFGEAVWSGEQLGEELQQLGEAFPLGVEGHGAPFEIFDDSPQQCLAAIPHTSPSEENPVDMVTYMSHLGMWAL